MRFMAEHAQFFALLEVENIEKQFVDVLRRGTERPRRRRRSADRRAGIADGLDPGRGPRRCWPTAWSGAVGYYSPLPPHRADHAAGRRAGRVRGAVGRALAGRRRRRHRGGRASATPARPARRPARPATSVGSAGCRNHDEGGDQVPKYKFLSDEWIEEAKKIREEFAGQGQPARALGADEPGHHRRTRSATAPSTPTWTPPAARSSMDIGHLENPDLTVTLDYATAKAIIVDRTRRPACRPSWPARSRSRAT